MMNQDKKMTLLTMASSSRDPFTKYLESYNVYTRNYVELLCFLDADWLADYAWTLSWIPLHEIEDSRKNYKQWKK